jgi:DsbC/DsbD-like thiol-disulfide interchange protein
MKKLMIVGLCLLFFGVVSAQVQNPVQWNYTVKKVNETTYSVQIAATIEPGWHVYSQTTPEGGPVPTSIAFAKNPLLTLEGSPKEIGKLEQKHEPLFGVDVKQYSNKVFFVQTVKVKGKAKTALTGTVEFMACNDEMCLPPSSQKFSIALK